MNLLQVTFVTLSVFGLLMIVTLLVFQSYWYGYNDIYTPRHTLPVLWTNMAEKSQQLPEELSPYKLAMNLDEYFIMLDLLEQFHHTMYQNNLTYFMYGGTLVGSIRHQGAIPWDDDTDVLADWADRDKIFEILKKLHPKYEIQKPQGRTFWKFTSSQSRRTKNDYGWPWPFLDIWWYEIIDNTIVKADGYIYPKEIVFPPVRRKFGTLYLNAPHNSSEFLRLGEYDWRRCGSRSWNHKNEEHTGIAFRLVDCNLLHKYYPFVNETLNNGHVTEELIFNGARIHMV